jgi:4-hydroxy-tetrahydrodipicolinate synthase
MARIVRAFPGVFIGVKDATGSLGRVTEQRTGCGAGFIQLSGNDETALAFNASGGVGCISVTANVAPRLCAEFQAAWAAGDTAKALEMHGRLYPLHLAMFTDASPGPVKYALSRVKSDWPMHLRLPMTEANEASRATVDAAMAAAGIV